MLHAEPVITEELNLVNLEMRAGTPRTEALKNLSGERGSRTWVRSSRC